MKALVVGSNGTIGKAVVELLEEKGIEVIGASRSTNPSLDITDSSGIDGFFEKLGEVDAIVSVAGDAAFTFLDKVTDEDIQLSVNSKLLGQVNLVRKGMKNLRPGGVFVITGGILAYSPMPQTSMIAMVNAGLEGFARAVALELTEGRRIVVVHPAWVAETAAKIGMDPAPWPDAKETATAYLDAIEGTNSGEPVFVEGYEPETK
ncbi:MAG TPA: short chain dehydrogenase [Hanamia sp.]|jgi:NAD(P)-dependent dehydrogenase (short-subunit alcohol dehydrogenase family)|nr:short chain dehydrogenase [Hanamia sp.]